MRIQCNFMKWPKSDAFGVEYPVYQNYQSLEREIQRLAWMFREKVLKDFERPILVGRGSSGLLLGMGVFSLLNSRCSKHKKIAGFFPLAKPGENPHGNPILYLHEAIREHPDSKLIIVDDFVASGDTIRGVIKTLEQSSIFPSAMVFAGSVPDAFRLGNIFREQRGHDREVKIYGAYAKNATTELEWRDGDWRRVAPPAG